MGCLADTVGTTLSCDPISGRISLSEIGISEREVKDYMSADHTTPEAFITERIAMAERVVNTDVLGRYASRIVVNTFLDRGRIGDYGDLQELQSAAANTDNGLILEVCSPNANLKIEISRIEVYTDQVGDVDVRFYDLQDGSLVHTETITAVANKVTADDVRIVIPIRRRTMRLLVVTDLSSFYRSTAGKGGCSTCKGDSFVQGIVKGYGARISTGGAYSYANVERSAYTAGLSVTASVVCDHAAWVCEVKEQLILPMGLQTAKQIQVYGFNNVYRFTDQNRSEEAKKAIAERASYYESEYSSVMDKLFKNMPLPSDEVCFDCSRSSRHTISIP